MDRPTPQDESPLELARLLANVLRVGTVAQVRARPAACRVQMGELLTDWLPWLSTRAGGQRGRTWWPPRVGEQCLVLSPGGELAQGRVLFGLFSDGFGPGSNNLQACRVDFAPKDFFEHDGQGNATVKVNQTLTLDAGKSIILKIGSTRITATEQTITLEAGGGRAVLSADGLRGTPDVFAGGVSGKSHVHGQVKSGSDSSGTPK